MSTSFLSDQLLAQAVAGDHAALERLLLQYYDRLAARIGRMLPDDVRSQLGVEDVLQDTFVQAFRDIGAFAPEGEQAFGAWLEAVADHRLQDALRRVRRKKRGGDYQRVADRGSQVGSQWLPLVELLGGDIGTPSQNAAQQEAVLAVQVGVSTLPADQREKRFVCTAWIDFHWKKRPKPCQRHPGAVRGLVQRGKIALRECLVRSSLWFSKR